MKRRLIVLVTVLCVSAAGFALVLLQAPVGASEHPHPQWLQCKPGVCGIQCGSCPRVIPDDSHMGSTCHFSGGCDVSPDGGVLSCTYSCP